MTDHRRFNGSGPQSRASLPRVAEAPSPGTVLTFERVARTHCLENVCYTLADESREEAYFKPLIAAVLKDAAYAPEAQMNTILSAARESWTEGAAFEIEFVKFLQLQLWHNPEGVMDRGTDSDGRDMGDITYVPAGKWVSWKATVGKKEVKYAQKPDTAQPQYYKVLDTRGWPFKVNFRLALEVGGLPAMDAYGGQIKYIADLRFVGGREGGIEVTVGEHVATIDSFAPETEFKVVLLAHPNAERLFKAKQYWPKDGTRPRSIVEPPRPRANMTPMEEAELDPANMDNTPDPNARFQSHNDVICLYKAPSKKEAEEGSTGTYIPLANFDVVQYLSLFTFIDADEHPLHRLVLRIPIDMERGDRSFYLAASDTDRNPRMDGLTFLDVETDVNLARATMNASLAEDFQRANARLRMFSYFKPSFMGEILNTLTTRFGEPPARNAISYFGTQRNGSYVYRNVCVLPDTSFATHEEAGLYIAPSYFEKLETPLKQFAQPSIMVVPYAHVRYAIGYNMYNHSMPDFFKNNLIPAYAVLAYASFMGMHTSNIKLNEACGGKGVGVAWLYSEAPGTGKTEAMQLANAMLGNFNKGLVGGDVTKPGINDLLAVYSDMPVAVDDWSAANQFTRGGAQSKPLKDMIHEIFDQTARTVCRKVRVPRSSCMFSVRSGIEPGVYCARFASSSSTYHAGNAPIPEGCIFHSHPSSSKSSCALFFPCASFSLARSRARLRRSSASRSSSRLISLSSFAATRGHHCFVCP